MSLGSFFVKDMDGILIINKQQGLTSFDVVHQLKKKFNTGKVGHCGTLDPLATGVLVVCLNKATKLVNILTSDEKIYEATLTLGKETTTLDEEGEIIKTKEVPVLSLELINNVFKQFIGEITQEPPIYSAIKVNGKKLYEYARNNEPVEIPKRQVKIHELTLIDFNETTIRFRVHVSKGTYIRSLCRDLGYAFNTVGYMSSLCRLQSGPFRIEQSIMLEDVCEDNILTMEQALVHLPKLVVDDEASIIHGKRLFDSAKGIQIVYNRNGKALAIYEQDGNNTLKCVRGIW